MSRFASDFICRATAGRLEGGPFTVDRVAKDTR